MKLAYDLVIAAFFQGTSGRDRETKLATSVAAEEADEADRHLDMLDELRQADPPLVPFHRELSSFPRSSSAITLASMRSWGIHRSVMSQLLSAIRKGTPIGFE